MRSTSTIAAIRWAATLGADPARLFALADAIRCGLRFLAAYVAGFETETSMARAVHFHHYTKGWHPTVTLGVSAAAAASARGWD